jgi:hypothetical protein
MLWKQTFKANLRGGQNAAKEKAHTIFKGTVLQTGAVHREKRTQHLKS